MTEEANARGHEASFVGGAHAAREYPVGRGAKLARP
jgi:hypothetical protein